MRVTADTNILVRAVMRDDPEQGRAAARLLQDAEAIAVPLPALCEFVWVLHRVYRIPRPEIARAVRTLLEATNVLADRPAADAGLAVLEAGGDFADALIAHEGRHLGADIFVSFDRDAVARLDRLGQPATLLA